MSQNYPVMESVGPDQDAWAPISAFPITCYVALGTSLERVFALVSSPINGNTLAPLSSMYCWD